MYEIAAKAITNKFVRCGIINSERQDVYNYGFELMISYLVYFIIFSCISLLTSTLVESYFFFIGFMFVRKFAGGIHAKTYIRCHILFELNHLLFIAVHHYCSYSTHLWIVLLIELFSIVVIWVLAPVDNSNKRLTINEKRHFKKMSRVYTVFIGGTIVAAIVVPGIEQYVFSYSVGVCSASLSLLLAYFQEKFGVN